MIAVGALTYDPETRRVYKYGRALSIAPAPLRLLVFLMEHAERSFGTDELIGHLWGSQVLPDAKARALVRSQVRRIRFVIEDGDGPWLVNESRSAGYGLWIDTPVMRACQLVATS